MGPGAEQEPEKAEEEEDHSQAPSAGAQDAGRRTSADTWQACRRQAAAAASGRWPRWPRWSCTYCANNFLLCDDAPIPQARRCERFLSARREAAGRRPEASWPSLSLTLTHTHTSQRTCAPAGACRRTQATVSAYFWFTCSCNCSKRPTRSARTPQGRRGVRGLGVSNNDRGARRKKKVGQVCNVLCRLRNDGPLADCSRCSRTTWSALRSSGVARGLHYSLTGSSNLNVQPLTVSCVVRRAVCLART